MIEAVAAHLSPRAGASLDFRARTRFVSDALFLAHRCPACALTVGAIALADAGGDFAEGVDFAIGAGGAS